MTHDRCTLAIELSSRTTEVGLGRGNTFLGDEPVQRATRHADDLVPAIDRLLRRHGLAPRDLGAVAVSIGPGGFTGLRLAVTTAKMFAFTLGVPIAAVPTAVVVAEAVERLAAGSPHVTASDDGKREAGAGDDPSTRAARVRDHAPSQPPAAAAPRSARMIVTLASKRNSLWVTTFEAAANAMPAAPAADDNGPALPPPRWHAVDAGRLATLEDLPITPELRPDRIVVDHAPDDLLAWCRTHGVTIEAATLSAEGCWRVGARMLAAGKLTQAVDLTPLYARPPEAVRLWELRGDARRG